MKSRLALAAASLSVLAIFAGSVPSASAADPSCDDAVALQASVADAQTLVTEARVAFHAANRPLGRLIAAKRHEARSELTRSRSTLRVLTKEARTATSAAERLALHAELRTERRAAASARNLLDFKRVTLAAIKADRRTARAALVAARVTLVQLTELEGSCAPVAPTP
jgi:hypothetical protein